MESEWRFNVPNLGMEYSNWRLAARLLEIGDNFYLVSIGHRSNMLVFSYDPDGNQLPQFEFNTLNNQPFPGPFIVEADH